MIKPYIKIHVNLNESISAFLIVPGKSPKRLNPNKVEKVLDKYNDMSNFYYDGKRTFYTDDSQIIHEFLASKITPLKRVGALIGTGILVVSLINSIGISTAKDDGAYIPTEKTQIIEIVPPNEPRIINEKFIDSANTNSPNEENTVAEQDNEEITVNEQDLEITEPVFNFDYEDRSTYDNLQYVIDNYTPFIQKYCEIYGVDPIGFTALVAQENPYNTPPKSEKRARGVTQIENVWWGSDLYAYNFNTKEYDKECIDADALVSNPEYAIKIGCMILNQYYEDLYYDYVTTGILTNDECITAAYTAYNKGLYAIKDLINTYGKDYINHREEAPNGDNLYIEHVFSYLEDGTLLSFKNTDGSTSSVYVDNEQSINFTPLKNCISSFLFYLIFIIFFN